MLAKTAIPALSLSDIVKPVLGADQKQDDYFVASFASPMQLSAFPHRAAYFGIAICTKGSAVLLANLESYTLLPGSLIVMEPEAIRSWSVQSHDYEEEILFFTESFFQEHLGHFNRLNDFVFFQSHLPKAVELNNDERTDIYQFMQTIKKAGSSSSSRKDKMVASYIYILLNQVADLYDKYAPIQTSHRNSQTAMVHAFKKLLVEKHLQLRSVNGYADLMNVSAKHLSETIKANTGRTAREWIHDILILEAKVRLKQTTLTVASIAESLNFGDASLFGKYFRRYVGCSPATYRKSTAY